MTSAPMQLAKVLPADAALRLHLAAATPLNARRFDPKFDRTKAVEAAIAHVKRAHPQFFRKD